VIQFPPTRERKVTAACGCVLFEVVEWGVSHAGDLVSGLARGVRPCQADGHMEAMREAAADGGPMDEIVERFERATA
jgi:hypothetical protein